MTFVTRRVSASRHAKNLETKTTKGSFERKVAFGLDENYGKEVIKCSRSFTGVDGLDHAHVTNVSNKKHPKGVFSKSFRKLTDHAHHPHASGSFDNGLEDISMLE